MSGAFSNVCRLYGQNFYSFKGRATRLEILTKAAGNLLANFLAGFVVGFIFSLAEHISKVPLVYAAGYMAHAILIPIYWQGFAVMFRRFQDFNVSGWWGLGLLALMFVSACSLGIFMVISHRLEIAGTPPSTALGLGTIVAIAVLITAAIANIYFKYFRPGSVGKNRFGAPARGWESTSTTRKKK